MIYFPTYRHPQGRPRSRGVIRLLALLALSAYAAGAALHMAGPETAMARIGGLLLILLSMVCWALLASTRPSRITGDVPAQLDEYERNLRAGAIEHAYGLLSGLIMLLFIYFSLAEDHGWWLPRSGSHWSLMIWGVLLVSTVLPPAVLSFRLGTDEGETA